MNIFFYSGGKAREEELRFAQKLLQRRSFCDMVILPRWEEQRSPVNLQLHCGDIFVLCAASDASLDELLIHQKRFEDFLVILVLPSKGNDLMERALVFRPCYVTSLEGNMTELETVVKKIILNEQSRDHTQVVGKSNK